MTCIFRVRRGATDSNLTHSSHDIYEKTFQRYNLARFPCSLKRLQTSYEKLIELCVIGSGKNKKKEKTETNSFVSNFELIDLSL